MPLSRIHILCNTFSKADWFNTVEEQLTAQANFKTGLDH